MNYEANELHVKLLDGSINRAVAKYQPSDTIDFAILKLETTSGSLPICTGLRNRNDEFVPGQVFMEDEFTLNPETEVYKWGSTTNLTTGIYKETYEKIEHRDESYPSIVIRNDPNGSFCEPGDSGSLVCFTGYNSEVAACLLIGQDDKCRGTFPGHRIADGISLIKKERPKINHLFTN
ncbi:unnamed protein product [Mytilus edulis]|uniref:Uncharacterized protein n=1 Tax=Mytilus edulis TaxID=6550 RepID=A0A8S3RYG2_MYTED|nr:unnamed protein product [Mytilus edulis]